jgi:hypothetical protein
VLEIEGLSAFVALKWPAVMAPVQPSPVNSTCRPTVAVEDGDGLVVGDIEFAEDVA